MSEAKSICVTGEKPAAVEYRDARGHRGCRIGSDGSVWIGDVRLKGWLTDRGYRRVTIRGKSIAVHRLVAQAFIQNPTNRPEVNHKDGCKDNNAAAHLEWCNRSENMRHCYRIGLHPGVRLCGTDSPSYGRKGSLHVQSMAVRATFPDGTHLDFESQEMARDSGFSPSKIGMCISGKRKSHRGATWQPLPLPPPEVTDDQA